MKVHIGKYKNWIGPYQIAELLKYVGVSEDTYYNIGTKLADTWLMDVCNFIHKYRTRKVSVTINYWDTWDMRTTLAYVALPMLKQLKATKQSSPFTDDEDVPEALKSTNDRTQRREWETDNYFHARWDWILSEMIWAFEAIVNEEDEFLGYDQIDNYLEVNKRIDRGVALFGKYYRGLWD
jgi:hypothetical protein